MQSIFLDTNAAIWSAAKPENLGKNATRLIKQSHEVSISAITIAELNFKSMKGTGPLISNPITMFEELGIKVKAFPQTAAMELLRFGSLVDHDAFDRLILAHAASSASILITSDRALLSLGFHWVQDARA